MEEKKEKEESLTKPQIKNKIKPNKKKKTIKILINLLIWFDKLKINDTI